VNACLVIACAVYFLTGLSDSWKRHEQYNSSTWCAYSNWAAYPSGFSIWQRLRCSGTETTETETETYQLYQPNDRRSSADWYQWWHAIFRYYSTAFLISCKSSDVRVHICPRRTGPRLISARGACCTLVSLSSNQISQWYSWIHDIPWKNALVTI